MTDSWKIIFVDTFANAEIPISGSEIFGGNQADRQKKDRYGSYNSLIITSVSANDCIVTLDTNKTFGVLWSRAGIVIKPEDGIYFDTVTITNLSAAAVVTAADIKIRMERRDKVV